MRKIFIIDNLHSIIDFYADFLSLKGYEIAVATSVEDFMKRHYQFHPDLIIYDTDMPAKESKEFIEMVSKFPDKFSIPVLFLTGFINESKLKNFESMGNCSFLSKDSSNGQVLNRIKRLMDGFRNKSDSKVMHNPRGIEQTSVINN